MVATLKGRRRSGSSSSSSSRSSGSESSVPRGFGKPGQKRHSRSRSATRFHAGNPPVWHVNESDRNSRYDHHDDRIGGAVTRDSQGTSRSQNTHKRGGMRGWSDSDDDAGRYQLKAQKLPSASSYRQASKAVAVGLATRAADQSIFIADKDPMQSDLAERSAGAFDFASRDVGSAQESLDKRKRPRSRDRNNEDGNMKRQAKEAPKEQKETRKAKDRKGREQEDEEDYSSSDSSEDDRRKEKSKKERQREKEKQKEKLKGNENGREKEKGKEKKKEKEKEKDREKEKGKEKEKGRESEKGRAKEKEKGTKKETERQKEKEHSKAKEFERRRESSRPRSKERVRSFQDYANDVDPIRTDIPTYCPW
eukprot:TRINITY_DN2058_c0_g1_i1.p1 TRINITY_DN2058_c0_g1~~TRINITY_DN2058_c0_g1_i1.p1  ORF type:complete len:417 (+),score=95.60 TRINITY_DN2058_c0_g1_i1:158-1252(+)